MYKFSSQDTLGRNNGLFFSIHCTSQVLGPLFAGIYLEFHECVLHSIFCSNCETWNRGLIIAISNVRSMFGILTGVGVAAALLFLCIQDTKASLHYKPAAKASARKKRRVAVQKVVETFKLFGELKMLLMIPLLIATSFAGAFTAGKLGIRHGQQSAVT